MTDFASDFVAFLSNPDEAAAPAADRDDRPDHDRPAPSPADPAKQARSLRRGIVKAASLQDMLLEKVLHQMLPVDETPDIHVSLPDGSTPDPLARPGFTVGTMSTNFRRFNARIGVVFHFQSRLLRLLSWRQPTHTLSLLAVYTFICLDPYLLLSLPLISSLFFILVPSFIARHPPPGDDPHRVRNLGYSPRGPPLAPPLTVKPVKELSRDFFRNLGDLQNVMEDFSVVHDAVISTVLPLTNFSDEALSSAVFLVLCAAVPLALLASHLLPWRLLALLTGHFAVLSLHPTIASLLSNSPSPTHPTTADLAARFDAWLRADMILDDAPETAEVEIFELQHQSPSDDAGEWEPWLFSPEPHDPRSAGAGSRPRGARFFEDVMPPEGWEWSEKKWALDLYSREWVEERIITGVEVETEGERWVYDMAEPSASSSQGLGQQGGWEGDGDGEGEGVGGRGEWRRRRWVRLVRRRVGEGGGGS
ncbi:integral peroxisomal membrane peroxin-domain-containing protein [Podospora conica]|nr:integral peroxisomal membrane peroxin-domain-containing protein [Schizothecium conicum]